MVTRIVADRPEREGRLALAAAWVAFVLSVPVFEPDARSAGGMAIGALVGAVLIAIGFAAASRVRPLPMRPSGERPRLVAWSLGLGVAMAAVNLSVNYWMASLDPALHRLLTERFAQIPAHVGAIAAPVIEEVVFRLVCLGVVAFVLARFVRNRTTVFWTAVAISAFVFGVIHIARPEPLDVELMWIYRVGVTLKSTIGGVLLGWIYWRWGLPYSIVCHGTVNGLHAALEPALFTDPG